MGKTALVNIVDEPESVDPGVRGPRDQQSPNIYNDSWSFSFPNRAEENDNPEGADPISDQRRVEGAIEAEFHGFPLVIEWEKGDTRKGESREGHKWERKMHADYGHIPDTEGEDGDGVDVYVGPDNSDKVFVVSQMNDGEYDEDKCMLGFDSAETAEHTYRLHYPDNGMNHFGDIEEMPLDDFLTKYMAKKTTNKKRRQKKTATPAGNNLIDIDQGYGTPATSPDTGVDRDMNIMWNESYSGQDNTAEGNNMDHMGSKEGAESKEGDVTAPYGHAVGPESEYMDKDHDMNITMFARVGKGEDPYIDGMIYGYDDLLKQHQKDVTANWDEDWREAQRYLWLRTTMKTADIISESEKWYRKNRNKKWGLEDRDKVVYLANLIMDGATITPLMVSPIGERKGGCWEGYHRLAAADMLQIKILPVIVKIDPNDEFWQERVAQHDRQPWVAVDLDGTILADGFSDVKGRPPLGEPLPGAKEALQELVDSGMRVSIWTARQYFEDEDAESSEWQTEIDDHLKYHQIPYTDIYVGKKPPADVFIDDKAVAFRDNWPQVLQEALQKVQKEAITMEAAMDEEAVIDMDAVDDPAMIGNNDNRADANVSGDGRGLSSNGPAQWPSDAVQGPLSGA